MECFRLLFDHLAWIKHQFLSGQRDSRKAGDLWGIMSGVGGVRKSIDQSWLAKGWGLGIGLLCWGFKAVQEEIPREEASTLQIGSVAFPPGQCTSVQLHPCHRLFEQDGHQGSCSPSLYSRPCSQWLLVIPLAHRLSLWDNWGDERGWDEGHWHAHARELLWGLSEVFGTVERVHCSRRGFLRRELEFHVCSINTNKVWKLIVCTSYIAFRRERKRWKFLSPRSGKYGECYFVLSWTTTTFLLLTRPGRFLWFSCTCCRCWEYKFEYLIADQKLKINYDAVILPYT